MNAITLSHEAMKQALEALYDGVSDNKDWMEKRKRAITALRQALEADAKPCSCCGDGNTFLSVTRICDTCGSEYAGQAEFDLAKRLQADQQAEPVAWINWCAATGQRSLGWQCESELASEPLYHAPQPAQQPLTDEQIRDLAYEEDKRYGSIFDFARAIERAHGIK